MSSSDEYKQVAALLAMDVETIAIAARNNPEMALELFEMLDERRVMLITDPKYREHRYAATRAVLTLVEAEDNLSEFDLLKI